MMTAIPRGRIYFPFRVFFKAIGLIFTGKILQGPYIEKFESAFAEYTGARHAVAVSSTRIGLYLSLRALGAKEGDEIIIPSYTIAELPYILINMGLKPVFIDIDPKTYNMDAGLVEKRITKKTKFILLTHLYGQPCAIDALLEIARRHNLRTIEDVAQSCGSEYKGKKSGTHAEIGYFSFGLFKNLNALGGGMVVTNNESLHKKVSDEVQTYPFPGKSKLAERLFKTAFASFCTSPSGFTLFAYPAIRLLHFLNKTDLLNEAFDLPDWERVTLKNYMVKFANIQGLVGLEQLKGLDENTDKRIKNAELLTEMLKTTPGIQLPSIIPKAKSIYLNYVVRIKNRDRLPKMLIRKGIDVTQSFLNSCPSIEEFKEFKIPCVNSDSMVEDNLCLPIQPLLKEKHMRYIADKLKEVIAKGVTG